MNCTEKVILCEVTGQDNICLWTLWNKWLKTKSKKRCSTSFSTSNFLRPFGSFHNILDFVSSLTSPKNILCKIYRAPSSHFFPSIHPPLVEGRTFHVCLCDGVNVFACESLCTSLFVRLCVYVCVQVFELPGREVFSENPPLFCAPTSASRSSSGSREGGGSSNSRLISMRKEHQLG